jgi:predicted negative regulator of RcsB-dependent stress response
LAAQIEIDAGTPEAAQQFLRRAIQEQEAATDSLWWRSTVLGLANLLIDLGRLDEGAQLLDEVEERGLTWGPHARSRYLQGRAKLAMARGEVESAVALALEAVEVQTGVEALQNEARANETLGNLLAAAGDSAGSREALQRARDLYAAKGYRPGELRVSAKLAAESPGTQIGADFTD